VLLPRAFRSLSRPSSPRSSKASTIHLYSLDHIIVYSSITTATPGLAYQFVILTQRSWHSFEVPCRATCHFFQVRRNQRRTKLTFFIPDAISRFCHAFPSLVLSNITCRLRYHLRGFGSGLLENRGFEPLTLGLQSRCSSQLS
jgi:hypothetical protein